jgi:peptidoglycan/LPS O-acetylase OafA/YrhL
MIEKLRVFKVLNDKDRISSIDIFRSVAILSVVIYHFNETLPFGYLGVDLFFVISGLLIGTILISEFVKRDSIHYVSFILKRGFKIWPSYYVFLIVGNLLAYFLYRHTHPDYYIPLNDYPRYLFFYKNFFGNQYHWCFEHVWSLCVEEHFYILFPLFLLVSGFIVRRFLSVKSMLFLTIIVAIAGGIALRSFLLVYYHDSINAYESTLVRLDQLSIGVLAGLLLFYYGDVLRNNQKKVRMAFIAGLLLFFSAIFINVRYDNEVYINHVFTLQITISFMLMIIGVYYVDFSKLFVFRLIAYYSYNWYLWHTVFAKFISNNLSNQYIGLSLYLFISFAVAVIFTVLIEERFLSYRARFIDKLFSTDNRKNV